MDDNLRLKLINLLSYFKNKPNTLAKFLIDNNAFNKTFINKISKSNLHELMKLEYISDITKMEDFYNSLLDNKQNKTSEEIIIDINNNLDEMIKNERFEDAAILRDYMIKKSIKRLK